ncbi:MAG: hypothetical protein M1835_003700 [Candelina submexicana]|nr:MAG: hypothetical protein M1835_003700 [Candelina submexicana]
MSSVVSLPATPPCSPSRTPSSDPEGMYNTLRPIAYIHRGNNVYVPLIAVDELPPGVNVREVPRTVRLNHTSGMTNVGTFTPTRQHYTLEGLENIRAPRHESQYTPPATESNSMTRRFHAPDAFINRSAIQTGTDAETVTPNGSIMASTSDLSYSKGNWMRTRQTANVAEQTGLFPMALNSPAHVPAPPSTTQPRAVNSPQYTGTMALRLLPPSGREPVLENKTYCTFWLKTGCCDYIQQGCKYKHEMPDAAGLVAIGLPPDPPKWWKDRQLHNWRAPANPNARPGEDPTAAFKLPQKALTAPTSPSPAPRKPDIKRPVTSEAPIVPPARVPARQSMKPDSPAQRQIDAIIKAPQRPPAVIPGFETLKPTPVTREQPTTPPPDMQPALAPCAQLTPTSSVTPDHSVKPTSRSPTQPMSPSPVPTRGLASSRYAPGARFIPAGEPVPQSAIPITRGLGSPFATQPPLGETPLSSQSSKCSISSPSAKMARPAATTPIPPSPQKASSQLRSSPVLAGSVRPAAASSRVQEIKEVSSSEDAEDDKQAEIYPEHKRRSEIPHPRFQVEELPKCPRARKVSKADTDASGRAPRTQPVRLGGRVGRIVKGRGVYEKPAAPRQCRVPREATKDDRRAKLGNETRRQNHAVDARKEARNGEQDLLDLLN